nr:Chain G, DNA replication factor Cdt1 [Homo sapiens]6QCG_H Chain H, DNA replication factor Cdt1 [Homo sapiens]6QCG_I Chain I, DNA replication factor Cdt1 [Homo sapiens]6QCG_J Chain J, DNA replication factor Cdt1 [Homo sapiens]6QCG_K Chain K, DNA replication factor Cdt1 [Homo sapiens]6QCG_L Chain L, DNA replication factor Cdt1 [Homo sapiens]
MEQRRVTDFFARRR